MSSATDVHRIIRQSVQLDPIGLLHPDVLQAMTAGLISQFERAVELGTKPENFANVRRITQRLPRWTAKLLQVHSTTALQVNLLCTRPLLALAHNMGPENREHDLLHLSLLAALDVEVLRHPFADQGWSPAVLRAFGERFALPHHAVSNSTAGPARAWQKNLTKDNGRALRRAISELAHPATRELIDYGRLMRVLEQSGPGLSGAQLLSVTGVMSANLLLHGRDVTRDGLSRMQAIQEVVLAAFEQPDTRPVYYLNTADGREQAEELASDLRSQISKATRDQRLHEKQNRDLRTALSASDIHRKGLEADLRHARDEIERLTQAAASLRAREAAVRKKLSLLQRRQSLRRYRVADAAVDLLERVPKIKTIVYRR